MEPISSPDTQIYGTDTVTKNDPGVESAVNPGESSDNSNYTVTPTNPGVATSDDHRGMISDLGDSITDGWSKDLSALNDTTGIRNNAQISSDQYQTYRDNLKTQESNDENNINADYNSKQTDLANKQSGENGTQSSTLARIGGYLGAGSAGEQVMQNLSKTHAQEVNNLENSRKNAISQAQAAYNTKDFAAAKEQMTIASNLEKDINARQKDFADKSAAYYKAVNDKQKADLAATTKQQATQQKNQQFAIKNGITKPFYTIDGTTLISTATGQPLTSMDDYKALGGKGDGSDIQYTSSTPVKFETKSIVGEDGQSHLMHIGYNAQGHVISESDLGASKKTGGVSSGKYTASDVKTQHNQADQAFASVKGSDGKVSPDNYNKAADYFVSKGYGTYKQFYAAHSSFVNPLDIKKGLIKGAK